MRMICWVQAESSTELWVIFDETKYAGVMIVELGMEDLATVDMAYEE